MQRKSSRAIQIFVLTGAIAADAIYQRRLPSTVEGSMAAGAGMALDGIVQLHMASKMSWTAQALRKRIFRRSYDSAPILAKSWTGNFLTCQLATLQHWSKISML